VSFLWLFRLQFLSEKKKRKQAPCGGTLYDWISSYFQFRCLISDRWTTHSQSPVAPIQACSSASPRPPCQRRAAPSLKHPLPLPAVKQNNLYYNLPTTHLSTLPMERQKNLNAALRDAALPLPLLPSTKQLLPHRQLKTRSLCNVALPGAALPKLDLRMRAPQALVLLLS
jgi:hypothetical protein